MSNHKYMGSQWTSAVLVMAFVIQPILFALPAQAAVPSNPQQEGEKIYAPFVSAGVDAEIEISSPKPGSIVAGSFVLAAQPLYSDRVLSIDFFVNNTALGTDDTPADGFSLLLDSNDLRDGDVTLRGVARGKGEGSAQITVTNVQNLPQETTANANGAAAAASQIGSVIMVPPGGLPAGATLKVTEKSQEEVTAEHNIDWERLGVTFLGAQEVETSAPMQKPSAVSSAGFGTRVQPGQAVVNYNILPDANGDGVGEIVVVNTARVAANGDVVSAPLPEVTVGEITVLSLSEQGVARSAQAGILGAPGTIIEMDVTGFNLYSFAGNVARFKSQVNDQEIELSGLISQHPDDPSRQIFSTQIPPLPAGAATMTLVNLSTLDTSDPITITVEAAPALDRPAAEIIDDYFATAIAFAEAFLQGAPAELDKDVVMLPFTRGRQTFQELATDDSVETQQYLEQIAQMIITSGALNPEFGLPAATIAAIEQFGRCFDPKAIGFWEGRRGFKNVTLILLTVVGVVAIFTPAGPALAVVGLTALASGVFREFVDINTPDCPPRPSPPTNSLGGGGGTTGMGSAPPPGGNGFGNAVPPDGSGGLAASNAGRTAAAQVGPGHYMIKVYSNGIPTIFTGMTDTGGYFFLPLIPANEDFVAIATNTSTGETRTTEGIGPQTGDSVSMFFDFFSDQENIETVFWDGGGDGASWHDPFNWNPNAVPGASQHVVIDVSGTVTVTHSRETDTIRSLHSAENLVLSGGTLSISETSAISGAFTLVGGGTLAGNGEVTFNGLLRWTSGNMQGTGKTVANGGIEISGPSPKKLLGGRTLENNGTAVWSGGALTANNGSIWHNRSGATFDIRHDGNFIVPGGSTAFFNNEGTVIKSAGTGFAFLQPTFNNSGSVDTQIGTLSLRGASSSSGNFGGSGILQFEFKNHTLGPDSEVSGNVTFASGATVISGTYSADATIVIGGKVSFNATAGTETLALAGGALDGAGEVVVGDLLTWTGGAMQGTGTTVANGGIVISGTGTKQLFGGRVLENNGTAIWSGGAIIANNGSMWHNRNGATLDIRHDGNFIVPGGSSATLTNEGLIIKSAGTGTAFLQPTFNHSGSVDVQIGTLSLRGICQCSGTFQGGGVLQFESNTHVLGPDSEISGNVTFASGTTIISGTYKVANTVVNGGTALFNRAADSGTLTLSAGVLGGTGEVTLNGLLRWTGGSMQGAGTTVANGGIEISGSGTKQFLDGRTLENSGTATWSGGTVIASGASTLLNRNGATLDIQHDGNFIVPGGSSATFINEGELIKSGGGATAALFPAFNNSGSVTTNSGAIAFRGSFSQSVSGILNVQIGGLTPLTDFDQVQITGQATLDGTLNVRLVGGYTPNPGDDFEILTFNSRSGEFATVNGNGQAYTATYGASDLTLTAQ